MATSIQSPLPLWHPGLRGGNLDKLFRTRSDGASFAHSGFSPTLRGGVGRSGSASTPATDAAPATLSQVVQDTQQAFCYKVSFFSRCALTSSDSAGACDFSAAFGDGSLRTSFPGSASSPITYFGFTFYGRARQASDTLTFTAFRCVAEQLLPVSRSDACPIITITTQCNNKRYHSNRVKFR